MSLITTYLKLPEPGREAIKISLPTVQTVWASVSADPNKAVAYLTIVYLVALILEKLVKAVRHLAKRKDE